MSSKPTHTAYVVIDPKEGSEKKAQWIEVGAVWSHSDGSGFDLVIPPGISLARTHRLPPAQRAVCGLTSCPAGITGGVRLLCNELCKPCQLKISCWVRD